MRKCRTCGKEFDVPWEYLWRYKTGSQHQEKWFCSWKCLRAYEKKGAEKKMARTRQAGTPAKKPEKKDVVEVAETLPEETKVELVYDPSIAEEYRREQQAKQEKAAEEQEQPKALELAGVFSRVIRYGKYFKQRDVIKRDQFMRLEGNDVEIILTRKDWTKFSAEIMQALDQLGILEPKPAEIEGGGSTWWHVCPECHGQVDKGDSFCRHCGQALKEGKEIWKTPGEILGTSAILR